jgi:hypothetical protein
MGIKKNELFAQGRNQRNNIFVKTQMSSVRGIFLCGKFLEYFINIKLKFVYVGQVDDTM